MPDVGRITNLKRKERTMQTNVQIVNVSHDEWMRLWKEAKDWSISIDERRHEWIFKEAAECNKPVYSVCGEKRYLVTY